LAQHPEYKVVDEAQLVRAIQEAWRDGTLDLTASVDTSAVFLATNCRLILKDTRPYKNEFNLFCSADRLNRAFIHITGKSFAQTRDGNKPETPKWVEVPHPAVRDQTLVININGASPARIETLQTVVEALGFSFRV
jgi:hypothetical protein